MSQGPEHHPPEEELLCYAAGATPEWSALAIACHLTFCPACRDLVRVCDEIGGALLSQLAHEPGGEPLPAFDGTAREAGRRPAPAALPDPCLPRPLSAYLRGAGARFRFFVPGVEQLELTLAANGIPLRVLRFKPGYVIPQHGHDDAETLVLFRGSLRDSRAGRTYGAGDVCRTDAGEEHVQQIGSGEPCVALVVNEGRLVPRTWPGRLLRWVTGM